MHIDNDREEDKIESQTKMITSLRNVLPFLYPKIGKEDNLTSKTLVLINFVLVPHSVTIKKIGFVLGKLLPQAILNTWSIPTLKLASCNNLLENLSLMQ